MKNNVKLGINTKFGNDIKIEDYCIIGNNVQIGDGTIIGAYTKIHDDTIIGKNNVIKENCVIGADPQDLQFNRTSEYAFRTIIGDNNRLSAFVTIGRGSRENDTIIGDNNFLMNYTHVAHDCILADNIVIVNGTQIAGHVEIEDNVRIGGLSGIVENKKVGKFSMISAQSKATKDVPPFSLVSGVPAFISNFNSMGLRLAGVQNDEILRIKKAFDIFFRKHKSPSEAIKVIENSDIVDSQYVRHLIFFIKKSLERLNADWKKYKGFIKRKN